MPVSVGGCNRRLSVLSIMRLGVEELMDIGKESTIRASTHTFQSALAMAHRGADEFEASMKQVEASMKQVEALTSASMKERAVTSVEDAFENLRNDVRTGKTPNRKPAPWYQRFDELSKKLGGRA